MNAKWVHLYEILLAKVKYSEWKMRLSGNEVMGEGYCCLQLAMREIF